MKTAVIYVLKDRIIVHPMSTTKSGLRIADSPYLTLAVESNDDEVVDAIAKALEQSKLGLPQPTDWNKFADNTLEGMGLKSWKVVSDRTTKSCDIELENNSITIVPTAHDLTSKAAGFYGKTNEAATVPMTASKKEIYAALQLALSRCE